MEIRRLLSRKVMLAGILLYLFQAAVFVGIQIENVGLAELRQQSRQYNQLVEDYRDRPFEESLQDAESLLLEERNAATLAFADKLAYLAGYGESIQAIFKNAENIKTFSIFQNKDSFSYANTVKTAEDFERMQDVALTLDKDRATKYLLNYPYLSFFVAAFLAYAMYDMLRERDNGMWAVTHTMRKGRCHLAASRGAGLAVLAVCFYMLCFVTNLILSVCFYGMDDFGGLVQTLQEYAKYPLPISKGVYLCLAAGKNCLALITLGALIYLIYTALRSRNFAVVFLVAVFGVEWQMLEKIPVYSNLKMLKYVNLMRLFDCTALDKEYQNLNILENAVSASFVVFWAEVTLAVLCFGISIVIYGRQYPGREAWFDRMLKPVRRFIQSILEKLSLEGKEAYKILVSKRGMVLLLFGMTACSWFYQKTLVYYPDAQKGMDETYLTCGGSDWESFDAYVAGLREQRNQIQSRADEMMEQIREGIMDAGRLSDAIALSGQASGYQVYLKEYEAKQELRDAVKEAQGIEIYAMSDRGYSEIVGANSRLREMVIGVVLIALSIIFASQIFGVEKQAHTKPMLKCAGRGIKWLWKRKLLCCFGLIGMSFCILYGGNLLGLMHRYQTPYMEAPIQSLTFYAQSTAHISIFQLLVLHIVFRILLFAGASSVTLLISAHPKVGNQMYIPLLITGYSVIYIAVLAMGMVLPLFVTSLLSLGLTVFGIGASHRIWCIL